ncbi:hypothetical protein [Allocoleopsis franciscana]|uniref:Uncharacterized protein n=1 Tax=Allocoleopsis franciscana PCC 7113 TaxID=1173027 RepID=K9WRD9_9CYAN|nr:hypothetical protein [Allocoleopsis franciscana]AFZ22356.1 hypothetical protein Mic7113_6797 [Allocoleopsis franciscana PCC 7113]
MKHCDWLRLKREGENICAALRQQGYQCRQHSRRLSWKVLQEGHTYVLTWLPAPVGDWNLLPNYTSPVRQQTSEELISFFASSIMSARSGNLDASALNFQ